MQLGIYPALENISKATNWTYCARSVKLAFEIFSRG